MIIDVHTHIFPKKICTDREKYFDAEPAFERLYRPPQSKMANARELVAAMDANDVDRSVVFGFPWRKTDIVKQHNDYVLESVTQFPDRLIGFGCLNPFDPHASREAIRCLDGGLKGIGELAFYDSGMAAGADESLAPIMSICRERNVPVLIHTNEPIGHMYPGKTPNTLAQIYRLIQKFSQNTIILAHWGGGIFFFNLLKREVKANLQNVYIDTAASPFLYDPEIYKVAVQVIGANKILFGSDYPLINPSRYFSEMQTAGLNKAEIKAICGHNILKLLKN